MRTKYISLFSLLLFSLSCSQRDPLFDSKPNVILIVVDDAAYSDFGFFGGEISTPYLDTLSIEGVQFVQFNVTPRGAPTCASLLTGMDHHLTGLGTTPEDTTSNQVGKPGYEGYLNSRIVTLAEVLKDNGYHTYMSGKWNLGSKDSLTWPSARGFEETFVLLSGSASHWQDNKPILTGKQYHYVRNGTLLDSLPDNFYSTKNYTNAIIGNIEEDRRDGKPFFAYLSYTAPHNPLHAPKEYIDKYKGEYDLGWDKLAANRLEHLKHLKLIEKKRQPFPRPEWIKAWDELTEEQKKHRARDMEVYAAMIDYLDMSIGRLLNYLKKTGQYENTIIIFLSDNGADGTKIDDYIAFRGETADYLNSFDNSIDNLELPNSMTDIGPGWAWALSTPFRMTKGYVSQGGIQVPLIIKFPGKMEYAARKKSVIVHVMDIMPTILDYIGIKPPETYNGKKILPLQGMSLVKVIGGGSDRKFENRGVGLELFGMRGFRKGDWKLLKLPSPYGTGDWQLYNLDEDSAEMDDLAEKYPEKYNKLIEAWNIYAKENGFVEPDRPVAYSKPPKWGSY